mmetsp:Transcript_20301/g.28018  ORF Transcript_20301/g.28018 Transcript_20301/m.28018 type:complete len:308 (+) Transcript_20301:55-978(+)
MIMNHLGEFISMGISLGFVGYLFRISNQKGKKIAGWRSHHPLDDWIVILLSILMVLFCFIATNLDLPAALQPTDFEVAREKSHMRQMCKHYWEEDAHDVMVARSIVGKNALGKSLASTYSSSTAKVVNQVGNTVLFGLGAMASVFPILIFSALFVFSPSYLGDSASSVIPLPLSLLLSITLASAANFLLFFGFVDHARGRHCIHISGHWWTTAVTLYCFLLVLCHLYRFEHPWRTTYLIYFGIHQALTFAFLIQTQLYFHDDVDAEAGLEWAGQIGIPLLGVLFFILNRFFTNYQQVTQTEIDKKEK